MWPLDCSAGAACYCFRIKFGGSVWGIPSWLRVMLQLLPVNHYSETNEGEEYIVSVPKKKKKKVLVQQTFITVVHLYKSIPTLYLVGRDYWEKENQAQSKEICYCCTSRLNTSHPAFSQRNYSHNEHQARSKQHRSEGVKGCICWVLTDPCC